jgi:lipopolysaccharide export system permease protein
MSILGRYLSRIFVGQLLIIIFCAMSLLQLFDLMSNADDLLRDMAGQSNILLRYTLLRLPDLITFITPFSVLLAALMTFGRLHRHSELVAMQAAGKSVTRIVWMLLPALLAVSFLHFLVSDQLTPRTNRALADWLAASETKKPNDIALWLRDGDHLVSIGKIEDDGRRLEDVVIFKRTETGSLMAQTKAANAYVDNGDWWLSEVSDLTATPGASPAETAIPRQPWQTGIQPGLVKDLAAPPNALSIAKLRRVLDHPEIGSRPMHVYETWLHKSFSQPLVSIFMVALAAASVRGLQRQGGVVTNALVGFGGAFLFFVADGVLQALGEAGSIDPALAAWLPLLLLALIAAAVLYWVAAPRGRRKPGVLPGTTSNPSAGPQPRGA